MSLIETLLKELQSVGVHSIKNSDTVMLEILNTTQHNTTEIDRLIHELILCLPHNQISKMKLECPRNLLHHLKETKANMHIVVERVIFTKHLAVHQVSLLPQYEVWPPLAHESISLLSEIMQISLKDAKKFLIQMNEELPSQSEKMFTVYKRNNEPVGVVLPHIEPHTNNEGRMFWIGVHPRFQGKGMGRELHSIGLYRLKKDFQADTYLGITQIDNLPMKKIMLSNECIQYDHTLVSLDYINKV